MLDVNGNAINVDTGCEWCRWKLVIMDVFGDVTNIFNISYQKTENWCWITVYGSTSNHAYLICVDSALVVSNGNINDRVTAKSYN